LNRGRFYDSRGGNRSDGVDDRLDLGDVASEEDKEVRAAVGERACCFGSGATYARTGGEEVSSWTEEGKEETILVPSVAKPSEVEGETT